MTLEERSSLVLAFSRVLYVNGQSTDQTLAAAERFGNALGFRTKIMPRWGALQLQAQDGDGRLTMSVEADPTGVHMSRVSSAMRVMDDVCAGRVAPADAGKAIATISTAPPSPTWLFTLAAATGAVALAVIFGVQHLPAAMLIFVGAGAGAILRRGLAHFSANVLLQPFSAALLAGIIGAVAVRLQLSSGLRLVAVCPCMVLVPGPHLLNGAIDLLRGRLPLGASRIGYAGLIIIMICMGLLVGLSLGGVTLPASGPSSLVPLGYDVVAAGIAVAAYGTFFAMPWRMLPIPILIGMLAHTCRWLVITMGGGSVETGALVACLVVGIIVTPVAERLRLPFAALGFASVVSLIPGVYLFRMAGGLVALTAPGEKASPDLLLGTVTDGVTALLILLAMAFGLIAPKMLIEHFDPGMGGARKPPL